MLSTKTKRELKIDQRQILIDSIEIGIPSPQQILTWGERVLPNGKKVGCLKNSKTVNYKRFTPFRDGLFCERIFGPITSFVCACGKKQPHSKITFCEKCEVEYIDQRSRRYRLGYISLLAPVTHIWYLKGRPSYLSLFLGKRKKTVVALAYCNAYLIELGDKYKACANPLPKVEGPRLFATEEEKLCNTSPYKSPFHLYKSKPYPFALATSKKNDNVKNRQIAPSIRSLSTTEHFLQSKISKNAYLSKNENNYFGYKHEAPSFKELCTAKLWRTLDKTRFCRKVFSKNLFLPERIDLACVTPSARFHLAGLLRCKKKFDVIKDLTQTKQRNLFCKTKKKNNRREDPYSLPTSYFCKAKVRNALNGTHGKNKPCKRLSTSKPKLLSYCYFKKGIQQDCRIKADFRSDFKLSKKFLTHNVIKKAPFLLTSYGTYFYARQHTLPFLPNLVSHFYLRDALLNFTYSVAAHDDFPLIEYCHIKRWEPLRDVHKFMAHRTVDNFKNDFFYDVTRFTKNFNRESLTFKKLRGYKTFGFANPPTSFTYNSIPNLLGFAQAAASDAHVPDTLTVRTNRRFVKVDGRAVPGGLSGLCTCTERKGRRAVLQNKSEKGMEKKFVSIGAQNVIDSKISFSDTESKISLPDYDTSKSSYVSKRLFELSNGQGGKESSTGGVAYSSPTVVGSRSFAPASPPGCKALLSTAKNEEATKSALSGLELTAISEILSYTGGGALQQLLQQFNQHDLCKFLFAETQILRVLYETHISTALDAQKKSSSDLLNDASYKHVSFNQSLDDKCKPKRDPRAHKICPYVQKRLSSAKLYTRAGVAFSPRIANRKFTFGGLRGVDFASRACPKDVFQLVKGGKVSCSTTKICTWRVPEGLTSGESTVLKSQREKGTKKSFVPGVKLFACPLRHLRWKKEPYGSLRLAQKSVSTFTRQSRSFKNRQKKDTSKKSFYDNFQNKTPDLQKKQILRLSRRIYKIARRLKIAQLLTRNHRKPEWMILSHLPVLPPDLRPILQMSEKVIVASDLNIMYQRVIYRNNRHLRVRFIDFHLVTAIQRLVQDAVDRLIENGKGGSKPYYTQGGRPLKSLSDILKGKKGRFRLNLLGKRVDFSGRSVIVVSPLCQIHECGLPKDIALELYHYFLLRQLIVKKYCASIVTAKKMIKSKSSLMWDILRELMYHHPVLLNRAPTLHRLGIQAFQPKLVLGNAIWLHPLVCSGFNADFDGDQMGVHLPLSFAARAESWDLLWSRNNLLSPATGQPMLVPSQDMVLGFYYITAQALSHSPLQIRGLDGTKRREPITYKSSFHLDDRYKSKIWKGGLQKTNLFQNLKEILAKLQTGKLDLHTPVWLHWTGKVENEEGSQKPLEVRVHSFGLQQSVYEKYIFSNVFTKSLALLENNPSVNNNVLNPIVNPSRKAVTVPLVETKAVPIFRNKNRSFRTFTKAGFYSSFLYRDQGLDHNEKEKELPCLNGQLLQSETLHFPPSANLSTSDLDNANPRHSFLISTNPKSYYVRTTAGRVLINNLIKS